MGDKYRLGKQHSGIWKSLRDGDFEEEEVWDVLKNRTDNSSGVDKDHSSSLPALARSLPTAARMIPGASSSSNNSSASSSNEAKVVQQSAPVNVPDWSKIYRKNNKNKALTNKASRLDDDDYFNHNDGDGVVNYGGDSEEENDFKLPPHEIIAKRLARSQISSFSVLEGAGRTLKGRDLSKVRNAVLTKTGFLESP